MKIVASVFHKEFGACGKMTYKAVVVVKNGCELEIGRGV
jgi:hypothetical protein